MPVWSRRLLWRGYFSRRRRNMFFVLLLSKRHWYFTLIITFSFMKLWFVLDQVCNGFIEFLADGFCDDENNNVECYFDGGDCCFDVFTYFCVDCNCYYGKDHVITLCIYTKVLAHFFTGDLTIAFTTNNETLTTGFPLLFGD